MKRNYLIAILLFGQFSSVFSQWECPSQLGASLKPLGTSNLLWGTELTAAAGYLTNNSIFNTMALLGVDYTINQQTFYFEGGFKYWNRTDFNLNINYHNQRPGLRELYYQNHSKLGSFTLGLQSMRSSDSYLLNERVLGLNYKLNRGIWALNLFGGTVDKDFSRNGTFCNVSYLYDILPFRNRTLVGSSLGQTNMAGFTAEIKPSANADVAEDAGEGLGTTDETASNSAFHVETIGVSFYSEFGSWVSSPHYLSGLYSSIEVGTEFWFKPEIIYQQATDNRAIIYCVGAEKAFTLSNSHRISIDAYYYGLSAIDEGAQAVNLFSNIFSGNVLRLDSPDLPFFQLGGKYSIPDIKTHLKLQYSGQAKSNAMQEFNVELGKKFFNKLTVNAQYGLVVSPLLSTNSNLFRIELRLTF